VSDKKQMDIYSFNNISIICD